MASLQDLLVDLISLSLQGKQLHWHVQGPNFRPVHLQLDEVVNAARGYADDVAERSVALDVPVDGRPAVVAKEQSLTEPPDGWVRDEDAVRLMADAVTRVADRGRTLIDQLADDLVTQDLVIGIVRDLDKHAWMLRAQLVR
jgi:starvation-inducible DNA-binding protein